ncbi:CAP domain-containing protein [Parvibaculaceae bacterium PLY_AMNH_Bact1]|nr:CAP domain-containing protein [Parvibaculaceae bacterium PLY_AMNH_Bact1]
MQRLFSITSLAFACAFLAACSAGRPGAPAPLQGVGLPQQAASAANSDTPLGRAVVQAINNYRTAPPLSVNSTLQRAAAVHAKDMAIRQYRGHHNPEGQGPLDRVLAIDDNFRGRVGENIWMGTERRGNTDDQMAAFILQGWLNSPQHRSLLESDRFSTTGVGVAQSGDVIYVVQVFGDPS